MSYKISGKIVLLIITHVILGASNSRTGTSKRAQRQDRNSAVMDTGKEKWRVSPER